MARKRFNFDLTPGQAFISGGVDQIQVYEVPGGNPFERPVSVEFGRADAAIDILLGRKPELVSDIPKLIKIRDRLIREIDREIPGVINIEAARRKVAGALSEEPAPFVDQTE